MRITAIRISTISARASRSRGASKASSGRTRTPGSFVKLDDGTAYGVDWNPLSRLTSTGIIGPAKAALVIGARIAVTGNPIRSMAQIREHFPDYTHEVNPNTVDPALIRRVSDSWNWARQAQNPPDCKGK